MRDFLYFLKGGEWEREMQAKLFGSDEYWMFINAFIGWLDIVAMIFLTLHLYQRRRDFSFNRYGVSLAFLIYVTGHFITRCVSWNTWREELFNKGTISDQLLYLSTNWGSYLANAFNVVGMVMLIAILTWQIRLLWLWTTLASALAASLMMAALYFELGH